MYIHHISHIHNKEVYIMAIRNYYFGIRNDIDTISNLVDYRSTQRGTFNLSGNSYEDDRFSEGAHIVTSPIMEITDSTITTKYGSVYNITDMHPDYNDYLDAIDKEIPILSDWIITGSLRHGYTINGFLAKERVTFKILNQGDKNLLTVKNNKNEEFSLFVDWTSVNKKYSLMTTPHLEETDLYFTKDFEDFCGETNCKPILFPKKK